MKYYYIFNHKGRRASSRIIFDDMLVAVNYMMKDLDDNQNHERGRVVDFDFKTVCRASLI